LLVIAACSRGGGGEQARNSSAPAPPSSATLFTLMPSDYTGIHFANRITETREFNVFTYRNFYNGGGVAIGDLSGDSLPEIVLTSNQDGPRLYLNLGGFVDITALIAEHDR
jgi:hypothetical protein